MNPHIEIAIQGLGAAVRQSKGTVFTEADYGRLMCAVAEVYVAMEAHNKTVIAQAAEVERVKQANRALATQQDLVKMIDDLWGDDDD